MSENKRWKFIRFLGYALPTLLVVYVLSVGPVAAIVERISLGPNANQIQYDQRIELAESFYAPLFWCIERNDFCGDLYISYITFWYEILCPESNE